ncbi:MAG: ribosome assembly RNA-binding protein YhbY [Burkholderiales bacterium]|jgi:putative YhbY family RNA-binding protein|nr:ribosome assembly RNA-binding protein YhbY [Burkholderiales bacterium]
MPLTPADRSALRARAHALHPVVQIGNGGLSDGVLREIDVALKAHELIKVKVAGEDREARDALLAAVCEATGAEPVQSIGRMLVVWRARPEADPDAAKTRRPRRPPPRAVRSPKRDFQDR